VRFSCCCEPNSKLEKEVICLIYLLAKEIPHLCQQRTPRYQGDELQKREKQTLTIHDGQPKWP